MILSSCPWRLKPVGEQPLLDVAVAVAVLPVAEIPVAERVSKNSITRRCVRDLALADGAHALAPLRFHQPDSTGEELLHHALLDCAGLVAASFKRGDLGVHVGEDRGDGVLLVDMRKRHLETSA